MSNDAYVVVKITFHRIQSFLFAVPRFKAMIGANALLGETIRNSLVEIAEANHSCIPDKSNLNSTTFDVSKDPLNEVELEAEYEFLKDNPESLYKKGVISRDGGHFTAAFKNSGSDSAEQFIRKAKAEIRKKLPGVQFEIEIKPDSKQESINSWGDSPFRLPQFQVCQDTGIDVANLKRSETPPYISTRVKRLEKKADAFKKGKTYDIIGLLHTKLPGLDSGYTIPVPDNLEELAGSGYIAVIHADGNSMGERRKLWAGAAKSVKGEWNFDEYMQHEVKNEQFFHAMRVAVRASVICALHETFTKETLGEHKILPYHLLMLGGDDLLLITQPQYAFPFVLAYSKALKEHAVPYKDNSAKPPPISIGAGIAIASCKVPFFHLYTLAEELASSAKKLFRSQHGIDDRLPEQRSVVDWALATTSWVNDIEETRRQYEYRTSGNEKLCTMARPYFVLNKEGSKDKDLFTLETLWNEAIEVQKIFEDEKQTNERGQLARSQLKRMLHAVSTGDISVSKEKYQQLPKIIRDQLQGLFGKDGGELWHDEGQNRHLTQYKDFIELLELHYLGRQKKKAGSSRQDRKGVPNE